MLGVRREGRVERQGAGTTTAVAIAAATTRAAALKVEVVEIMVIAAVVATLAMHGLASYPSALCTNLGRPVPNRFARSVAPMESGFPKVDQLTFNFPRIKTNTWNPLARI